jgi:hypothetical protein
MSWVDWFLAGVAAACGSIVTRLVGEDLEGWVPALTLRCMVRAENRLSERGSIRACRWLAKLESVRGTLSPLVYAPVCRMKAEFRQSNAATKDNCGSVLQENRRRLVSKSASIRSRGALCPSF